MPQNHGWAQDVKARDRDAYLPRPRRDVRSSQDVIETSEQA